MILQGVGHQISCLGGCYANDPEKGGCTVSVPALDLITSLRGDGPFCRKICAIFLFAVMSCTFFFLR